MPSSVEPSGRRGAAVRPGAMTRAMSALREAGPGASRPRALRVAVVEGGRIQSERIVRSGAGLTIGRLERCDLIVADTSLPPLHALFASGAEGWSLTALPAMKVRVAGLEGAQDLTLTAPRVVALRPDARGRIKLGATTLLFQLVDPPPKLSKPKLPSSVSAGLFGETDWPFTMALTLALTACFAVFVGLDGADWPAHDGISAEAIREVLTYYPEPEPPPEPAALMAQDTPPEPEREVASNDTPAPQDRSARPARDRSARPRPAPSAAGPSADDPVARLDPHELANDMARQLVLGMEGELATSEFSNLLDDGAPLADAQTVLDQVRAVDLATSDSSVMRTQGSGVGPRDPGLGAIARIDPSRLGPRTGGEPVTETRVCCVGLDPDDFVPDEPGLFDDRLVIRAMRARTRRIQTCYEREMTASGGALRGKVVVEFTIMPTGTLSGTRALQNTTGNRRLAECVVRHVRGVRFREGPSSPAPYSFPWVFNPQE